MPILKYYCEEAKNFTEEYYQKLDQWQLELYFNKLKAHYKFRQGLVFGGRYGYGNCSSWSIRVQRDSTIGILVHEVAHALQFKKKSYYCKKGMRWHTKEHLNIMKRVFAYVLKYKNGWEETNKRRQRARMTAYQRAEERKKELVNFKKTDEYKISNLLQRKKRLETKKKRLETLIKKINKSLKYYYNKLDKPKDLNN